MYEVGRPSVCTTITASARPASELKGSTRSSIATIFRSVRPSDIEFLPAGVRDPHSHDLYRAAGAIFALTRRHRAPGEYKACHHLSREALVHQLRVGNTTQAGVGQYFERTAPLGAKGHLRIPASAARRSL